MKVLLLITGSIAAIKSPQLIELLRKQKHKVQYALSPSARNFVPQFMLENCLANNWYQKNNSVHVDIVKWADRIIVYPATFNTIGKVASGIADSFITTVLSLVSFNKLIFAPAMNTKMYQNDFLQANLAKLKQLGATFIGPNYGKLKDGDTGIGRAIEPEQLIDFLENRPKKKVLLTFGYTRVNLDPVRVVCVPSSGKSGLALIQILAQKYDLTVISGNLEHLNNQIPAHVQIINIQTLQEYYTAVDEYIQQNDCFISLCAVSDLIFKTREQKIKKNEQIYFEYTIGKDVLKDIALKYPEKIKIGYALESENILENGKKKLISKNLDAIIINNAQTLASDQSSGYIILKNGHTSEFLHLDKYDLAIKIDQLLGQLWKK
ncbi:MULTISPECIES: bifunctional phosphopantothenoylcysteine decarboxylase/phosphopantothenate--cysteine ligase CoaBC [unclassified Mycoplasma]|uniref:bifunctional phosphopantothenoylcysteine decarboxylase/phosphopantothenate--cysteine ligase CoaBC n=1 Tax=unclassified Mycoplasma TaxID=2683645 RepID=UPI00211C19BD|nr:MULTISPECIES: bifunctional phosphopantothenoylcysteine decarboxylase/phosphopantothenate--cysteine ligase CoaBC [unclassified Mycoplasma]UUM19872.1 bifunctional phosphopantothenoylcysteine decarboxylase/phosphopantothenate--cysteine ligase CoaBC [Mycoplasma sp. 1578d]UUM24856.1 bifunctional phosphopantothenoylcysteine decarboxylase/phosphopantothenate--cysteine ligase CoaBC [Mycoplasma sp. 3686d]